MQKSEINNRNVLFDFDNLAYRQMEKRREKGRKNTHEDKTNGEKSVSGFDIVTNKHNKTEENEHENRN